MYRVLLLVACLLVLVGGRTEAQKAPTCGWHLLGKIQSPETLSVLAARATDGENEALSSTLLQLHEWVSTCNATAARIAARTLKARIEGGQVSGNVAEALLALALLRGPDVQVERAQGVVFRAAHQNSNAEIEGARILVKVLQSTRWPELADELATVASATGNDRTLALAAEGIGALASDSTPAMSTSLAEVLLAQGNYVDARSIALRVPQSARAIRVEAIASILMGDRARQAAGRYLKGLLAATDPSTVQRYFDDLRLLLNEEELEQWEGLTTEHSDWLRRKWDWKAHLAGVHVEDRVVTHHQRIFHALENFRRRSYRGAPPRTHVWMLEPERAAVPLDDRGIMYVRHGPPTKVLRLARSSRIAWFYGLGPAGGLFEFSRGSDRSDYYLVEPHPVCADGRHVLSHQPAGSGYPSMGDRVEWATTLFGYNKPLALYYMRCERTGPFSGLDYVQLRAEARQNARTAWSTETAVPVEAQPLGAAVNLYAFKGENSPALLAYLAVPGGQLASTELNGERLYSLEVMLAVGDDATERVTRRDSTIRFVTSQDLDGRSLIGTTVNIDAPATADAQIRVSLKNSANVQQQQVLATVKGIPAFDGLTMSDVVIAEERDGSLIRGAAKLAPFPGHALAEGTPFRTYVEVYGLSEGDAINVQLVITPGREESVLARLRSLISERRAFAVTFNEQVTLGSSAAFIMDRMVDVPLLPGAYTVSFTVTNAHTGAQTNVETPLTVLPLPD